MYFEVVDIVASITTAVRLRHEVARPVLRRPRRAVESRGLARKAMLEDGTQRGRYPAGSEITVEKTSTTTALLSLDAGVARPRGSAY